MKVKNTSDEALAFTGIPAFEAGEVREVSEAEAKTILANPHFEKVKAPAQTENATK